MKTKLETLALQHIGELARDAQTVVLRNHEDMGGYSLRDSGFGKLNEKLRNIERWTEALLEST
jgi:hypothetical protein